MSNKLTINVLFVLMAVVMTIMSSSIVISTKAVAHPDESVHLDAFCYFQSHVWPPDLNEPSLLYSPDGWSRVYNGEMVYPLFGQIAPRITPFVQRLTTQFTVFPVVTNAFSQKFFVFLPIISRSTTCEINRESIRFLNVGLFIVTLLLLWFGFNHSTFARATALVLLMIPQVVYIYSYANSDAWGVSCSVLFTVYILSGTNILTRMRSSLILGILTSLVLLSKTPFWFALAFGWGYLMLDLWKTHALCSNPKRTIIKNLLMCSFTVTLLVTPLKIIYPLSQGDFATKAEQMREQHARSDFKPSNRTGCCYRMADKGMPFSQVATDREWTIRSLKSFYGYFGHMTIESPRWTYHAAILFLGINLFITLFSSIKYQTQLGWEWHMLALLSLFCVILNVFGSMYNSWTYDFQPQGRYLFPALVPLTILSMGTYDREGTSIRFFRVLLWFIMFVIALINVSVLI